MDVRQAYFSFGNADFGMLKLGRDNGIFGANEILNDVLAQGTHQLSDKLKLGLRYGQSRNSVDTIGTNGLKSNANVTLGAYSALNTAITLVAEGSQTRSKAFASARDKMNGISLGIIIMY